MQGSEFHFNPADSSSDFDCSLNIGSHGDVSTHIGTFHRGLLGGPIRDVLDPKLLRIERVPGTSALFVLYGRVTVAIGHVDQFGNLGAIEVAPRFAEMVARFVGKAAL